MFFFFFLLLSLSSHLLGRASKVFKCIDHVVVVVYGQYTMASVSISVLLCLVRTPSLCTRYVPVCGFIDAVKWTSRRKERKQPKNPTKPSPARQEQEWCRSLLLSTPLLPYWSVSRSVGCVGLSAAVRLGSCSGCVLFLPKEEKKRSCDPLILCLRVTRCSLVKNPKCSIRSCRSIDPLPRGSSTLLLVVSSRRS